MLRYANEAFIAQTCTKTFLEVVEESCISNKTTPVVRDRLLEVLAGAAYAYPSSGRKGFSGIWRRVKSPSQPDEGIPFDDLDPMFTLPPSSTQQQLVLRNASNGSPPLHPQQAVLTAEEEITTLYNQCEIASNNARMLSEAVIYTKPLELGQSSVIKEFYAKCMASQEVLVAQIPWATAYAERSSEELQEALAIAASNGQTEHKARAPTETPAELLLAAILATNQELADALEQYRELERTGQNEFEKNDVALRSINEAGRLDRTQTQYYLADGSFQFKVPGGSVSPGGSSRSASPAADRMQQPQSRSRTPSPTRLIELIPSRSGLLQARQKLSNPMPVLQSTVEPLSGKTVVSPFQPLPELATSAVEDFQSGSPVSRVEAVQDSPSTGLSIWSLKPRPQHSPEQLELPRGPSLQPSDSRQSWYSSRARFLETSSLMATAPVRSSTRASVWTVDTIQSAPSNRTVISPDWESIPLPDIAAKEEERDLYSPQDTTVPEPPATPPFPSPPQVPLLMTLEELPQWKTQITATAQLLLCDGFLTCAGTPVEPTKVRLDQDYKNFGLYQSAREQIERYHDTSRRATELVTSNLHPKLLELLSPILEKDGYKVWELLDALDRQAAYIKERITRRKMMDRLVDTRYEEGNDIRTHITAIRAALDASNIVEMDFRVMLLLSSLPRTPEWETFKDDILSSTTDDSPPTLDTVESALLRRSGST